MARAPDRYPNPRNDNAWDNDAVHWLLAHPDVAERFGGGAWRGCARRKPRLFETDIDGLILAARLCERYGIDQVQIFDPKLGKSIWRLRRRDPDAPEYPDYDGM